MERDARLETSCENCEHGEFVSKYEKVAQEMFGYSVDELSDEELRIVLNAREGK